jgi:hypothetical protein
MEPTPFELTPEQKGMLASLLSETRQPASMLIPAIVKALEELQAPEHIDHANGETNEHETAAPAQEAAYKPIWEIFADAFKDVPEEELARLPVDGAAQHDHYIYGLPKRSNLNFS